MKNHSIKFVKYIFYIILLIIMFFLFNNFFESFYKVTSVNLDIQGNDMGRRPIEVFYAFNGTDDYNGENMVGIDSKTNGEFSYNGGIALPCEGVSKFRIDLGNGKDKLITIKDVEYRDYYGKCKFDIRDIAKYSILHGHEQLFASKYKTCLPSEEQLREEIEIQKRFYYLQKEDKEN